MMYIQRAARTDVGMKRSNNQDSMGFQDPADEREWGEKGSLSIVADGMGGHVGGEIASGLAVETILQEYLGREGQDVEPALVSAVENANSRIFQKAQENPDLRGMGTTCTAMVLKDQLAYFAHVGDSRAYLIRDGEITQVTRDHSLVNQLIDRGDITPEEAESHPEKNVITRSLGIKPNVDVDTMNSPLEVREGDLFLLCSDGLSGLVRDEEMLEAVTTYDPDEAAKLLIDLANERGGPDNITVQIVRVLGEEEARRMAAKRKVRSGLFGSRGAVIVVAIAVLAVGGLAFALLRGRGGDETQEAAVGGASTEVTEWVRVESEPGGASVLLDHSPVGRTPLDYRATLGPHDVQVVWSDGTESEVRRIDLGLGGLSRPVVFRRPAGEEELPGEVEAVGETPEQPPEERMAVRETAETTPPPPPPEREARVEPRTISVKLIFIPKADRLTVDGKVLNWQVERNNFEIDFSPGLHRIAAYNGDFDREIEKEVDVVGPGKPDRVTFNFLRR
jgi:serine/threonine protein phosphatase PrpC